MSELAHPVYCIKCKKQIQADAQFCPYCGSGQKPPHSPEPPHASPTSPGPNTGPNVSQNVHVQVNNSAAGWIAATILAVFGTPIGCIVIPCLLLGAFCLLSIFGTVAMAGMMLFPTLLGLIVAFVIVRSNRSDADRTKGALVALAAGFVFNVAWWYLLQGRSAAEAIREDWSKIQVGSPIVHAPLGAPALNVDLDTFGRNYDDNKVAVNSEWTGKIIVLRGKVEGIGGDTRMASVRLRGFTTQAAVTCLFSPYGSPQVARLSGGQQIAIKGKFAGGRSQMFATDEMNMTECELAP